MRIAQSIIALILFVTYGCVAFTQQKPVAVDFDPDHANQLPPVNLQDAVSRAKTIYVTVYYGSMPGSVSEPPGADVQAVLATLKAWPMMARNDLEIIQQINKQLMEWGRFKITSHLVQADLIVVVYRGVDKFVDGVCSDGGKNEDCSRHIEREGSLSVYSSSQKPGLIWRKPQHASLIDAGVDLMPEFRKDVESAESSVGLDPPRP